MTDRLMHILQVNSSDFSGGAQKVAWNLFRTYREIGLVSSLVVGQKLSDDHDVMPIVNGEGQRGWFRFWSSVHSYLRTLDGGGRLSRWASRIADPRALRDHYWGYENFRFPWTWRLLKMTPERPDIIHCHNLHEGYFDLRALSWLSHQVPTFLTLHDAWLLSGHCAHSFDCERWKLGCGHCPYLGTYPAVRRDATAYNWKRKQEIFTGSRLYVATPSQWLMDKMQQSILARAAVEARVIPNGVDLDVFHPRDKREARETLGIAPEAKILLFIANGIRRNPWKDYETLRAAITQAVGRLGKEPVIFIALGENGVGDRMGRTEIRFVPYQPDPEVVARYFQAADLYVHAAKADTFPNTVIEALACGVPVIATAVGGIPEQIKGLDRGVPGGTGCGPDEATGMLTRPDDSEDLALSIEHLLKDELLRKRLGGNAVQDVRMRFDLCQQVSEYLKWYGEVWDHFRGKPSTSAAGSLAVG